MKNEYCIVEFNESMKCITGYDLTDMNNMPTFFTTKKRGLEKAYKHLEAVFNEYMKFNEVMSILDNDYKLSTHLYCAMD